MNRGIARQGFALITAVVIGAVILATIVGIATLSVRETRVQAEQNVSDQALVVAEGGLADVVSRINATDRTFAKTVIALGDDVVWEPSFSSGTSGTMNLGGHAFYWVKVVPQGTAGSNRDYVIYAAGFIVRPDISAYSSDDLKTLAASAADVVARRVVQMTSLGEIDSVTTTQTVTHPGEQITTTTINPITPPGQGGGSTAFDYGLFTGVTFNMSGSKNLFNATTDGTSGIFAGSNIGMSGSADLTNLQLYATGAIVPGSVHMLGSSSSHPGYHTPPVPTFPNLKLEAYMDLFDAFVAGTAPFDGSVADYPNMNGATNPLVRSAVLTALGNPQNNSVTVDGQAHHFVTPGSVATYTANVVALSLPGLNAAQSSALSATLKKSVFYVRTSATNPDASWTSSRQYLAGVIVCSGTVSFSGCPDFENGQALAVLTKGDINWSGSTSGSTPARGIFYTEGRMNYSGSGWFEGQLICANNVNWSGSGNITFQNYSKMLGNLLPGGSDTETPTTTTTTTTTDPTTETTTTTVVNGFLSFNQKVSGWTETDWLKFQSPTS